MKTKTRRKKAKRAPSNNGEETSQLIVQDMPSDLKADFKSLCAKNKTSMKAVLISFMEEYID